VSQSGLDRYLRDATTSVGEAVEDQADVGDDLSFNVAVDVDRICPGWGASSNRPDRAKNGHVTMTGVLRESVPDPVAWGTAEACRLQTGTSSRSLRGFLDGTLEVYVYGGLRGDLSDNDLLVHVRGTIGTASQIERGEFDFRVTTQGLQTRVLAPDRTFLVVELTPNGINVYGSNGTYRCNTNGAQCAPSRPQ
jgi:hypothetical protein